MSSIPLASPRRRAGSSRQSLAYAGLLLFTVLLYLRPYEWLPIGAFPVVKIIGFGALASFFVEQLTLHQKLSAMPRELKYLLILSALMILSIPFGLDPSASLAAFSDEFLKAMLIFVLMINVVTSFDRLQRLLEVTVLSGTVIAFGSVVQFARGQNLSEGFRGSGVVGGIFDNPNDLALALNMLLPIAVGLALTSAHPFQKLGYWACTGALAIGVMITYSRAGSLSAFIVAAFLLFKLARSLMARACAATAGVVLLALVPGGFWVRVLTIFGTSGDASAAESAATRWGLMVRSIEVAGFNPVRWLLGVGMQNFHIVSNREFVNHNAYLQVFNEVGLPALIVYLMLLIGVFRAMGRVAAANCGLRGYHHVWIMATAIQASLVAYAIGSFFASVAYLWYLYYGAGFAVCLKQLVVKHSISQRPHQGSSDPNDRVWYLRHIQH